MPDDFGTTLKVLLNSLAFFILIAVGFYLIKYNPFWGALIFLSALDQLEDVYFYVTKNLLIPQWFRPLDIIFEGVLVVVGMSLAIFGLIYWYSFDSWFFLLWMVASAFMTWSAVEDIVDDFNIISAKIRGVPVASVKEVRKFSFFQRLR